MISKAENRLAASLCKKADLHLRFMPPAKAGWDLGVDVDPRFRFTPPGATAIPLLRSWRFRICAA